MNIKELRSKYKDSKHDSILERNIILKVKVSSPFNSNDILVEDETGTLEVTTGRKNIFNILYSQFLN